MYVVTYYLSCVSRMNRFCLARRSGPATHLLFQQRFIEPLLYARHCVGSAEAREQDPVYQLLTGLVEEMDMLTNKYNTKCKV